MDINDLTAEQFTRIIKLLDGGALSDVNDGDVHIDSVFSWAQFKKMLDFVEALDHIDDIDFGTTMFRPWAHTAHRWFTADGGSITQHDDGTISVLWLNPPYPPRTERFHDWEYMCRVGKIRSGLFPLIEYKETITDA